MKSDLLFISPHLDDVVLSCSGLVITERLAGKHILVATVFDRGDDSDERRREYDIRHAEDKAAMDLLGVNYRWLNFPDAPVRNRIYNSFMGKHLDTDPADVQLADDVAKTVMSLCEETQAETIFLPLGIGSHIDHRLTYACASALPRDSRLVFYEDRPYVFLTCSLNLRLLEIGLTLGDRPPPDLVIKSRRDCVHSYLSSFDNVHAFRDYPGRGKERFLAFRRMARSFLNAKQSKQHELRPTITVQTDRLNEVAHAVAAYKSQISGLFGSVETFLKENRAYASKLGSRGHAERYWAISY